MITAADELRHPAGQGINWSESYYFTFFDAENNMAGFFRIGLEENKKQSNMWCNLMKDGKAIYNRFRLDLPYSEKGLEDVTVGGLRLRLVEALKTISISFSDRHLSIDLMWQGFHEAFDMREAMGEMSASVAKGHYEQNGEVRGRITLGDQTIEVRGYGFRDHSWGVRDWEAVKNWKTAFAQFGKDFAYAMGEINEVNGQKSYLGLIYNGKEMVTLRKASMEVDDISNPTRAVVMLVDKLGAMTRIDIEFILACELPYDFSMIHECYTRQRMGDRIAYGIVEINRRLG